MRKLQTSDIFAACRLVTAIDIKEDIKKLAMEANSLSEMARNEAGFDLIYVIFEKASGTKGEKELYKFFANVLECKPDDVAVMDPVELVDKIFEVAEPEKWRDFFSRVARLMKRN